MDKRKLYTTAQAKISCATIQKGDFVSVRFSHVGNNGVAWYYIDAMQHGKIEPVAYPEHHLEYFTI